MKETISLKYNKYFYPKEAINDAISDYKKIAKIDFSEQKKYYLIEMSEYSRESRRSIGDEFSNHILSFIGE